MKVKISLIIGIVLFILIIGATYSKTIITSNNNFNEINNEEKIEEQIIELEKVITCKNKYLKRWIAIKLLDGEEKIINSIQKNLKINLK